MFSSHVHFPSELPAPHEDRTHQMGQYPKMAQCKGAHDRETYDLCWKWASLSAMPCNGSGESVNLTGTLDSSQFSPSTNLVLQRSTASDRFLLINISKDNKSLVFDFMGGLGGGSVRPKNLARSSSTLTLPTRRSQSQKHTSSLKRSLSVTNQAFARSGSQDSSSSDSSTEGGDDLENSLAA